LKDEVVKRLKEIEDKLGQNQTLDNKDFLFLFGLSLIKDQK
jgi:hypothetical protein